MTGNLVITIGRECGSGGRLIGNRLAEKLNIKCYDKELLTLVRRRADCARKFSRVTMKSQPAVFFILL